MHQNTRCIVTDTHSVFNGRIGYYQSDGKGTNERMVVLTEKILGPEDVCTSYFVVLKDKLKPI